MTRFVALYRTPEDPAESERFEADYRATHLPLIARTPGLTRVQVSRVVKTLAGAPAPMLLAVLSFADEAALREGMRSEQWSEAGRNLTEIGGLELATMFVLDDPEEFELGR